MIFLLISKSFNVKPQDLTQTIRGTIKDKETLQPIIGAKIEVLNIEPYQAAVTNFEGKFRTNTNGSKNIKIRQSLPANCSRMGKTFSL